MTDATSFKEAYDAEVKDYMLQGGNYRRPQYDGAEARRMLQNYLDVGKENIAEQAGLQRKISDLDGPEGDAGAEGHQKSGPEWAGMVHGTTGSCLEEPRHAGLGAAFHRVMTYGSRKSPHEFLKILADGPGRVIPPEGRRSDESERDLGGAGLPIPEGCSSTARPDDQDGQSHPGDC